MLLEAEEERFYVRMYNLLSKRMLLYNIKMTPSFQTQWVVILEDPPSISIIFVISKTCDVLTIANDLFHTKLSNVQKWRRIKIKEIFPKA